MKLNHAADPSFVIQIKFNNNNNNLILLEK